MEISRGIALLVFGSVVLFAESAAAQGSAEDDDTDARSHEIRGTTPPTRSGSGRSRDRTDDEEPLNEEGGIELTLAPITFTSSLRSAVFSAQPPSGELGGTERFDYRGSAFGIDAPRFWGGEMRLAYLRRHVRIGALGFMAESGGGASHSVANGLSVIGGGGELSFVVPLDPITISIGGVVGGRAFSMPVTASAPTPYVATRTQQRAGISVTSSGVEATTGVLFFAQPQARVDVALGEGGWAFLGAFAGIDLVTRGESFGLMLGFRTPHRTLAW